MQEGKGQIEKRETKERADKLLIEEVAAKRSKIFDSIDKLAFEIHVMTSTKKIQTNEAKL